MEFLDAVQPDIAEPCPRVSMDGFHEPSEVQQALLLRREAQPRLIEALDPGAIVVRGDPLATLASAAVYQLVAERAVSAPAGLVGAAQAAWMARAIADLAVAGEAAYAGLQAATTSASPRSVAEHLGAQVVARLPDAAARLRVPLAAATGGAVAGAAARVVVGRALRVAWALNGPAAHRGPGRAALGWIASHAEADPPRRPVNVPSTPWPCADTLVSLNVAGVSRTLRTRYAIAGAADSTPAVDVLGGWPVSARPPRVDPNADLLVFLHGHSSRLEEGDSLYPALVSQAAAAGYPRPVLMVAFDFPSNGYSQYADHDQLVPFASSTAYSPDQPGQRRFGMLEFYERFVTAFVESLDRDLRGSGQPGILGRIAAVIGGSMGGNLSLRLAERLVSNPVWARNVVSWSPASAYPSFGRNDLLAPSPGEQVNPFAWDMLDRPRRRCMEPETADSRAGFMTLQIEGEKLTTQGSPELQALAYALGFVMGLGSTPSAVLGLIDQTIVVGRQSDRWVRAECRSAEDTALRGRGHALELTEVYNPVRRRTHWRLAYEQLLFSHQDAIAASHGVPCCQRAAISTLLIGALQDTPDWAVGFDIPGGVRTFAPTMRQNSGRAMMLERTGHSVHAERPQWLAREIFRFLLTRPPKWAPWVPAGTSGGSRPASFEQVSAVSREREAIDAFGIGSDGLVYRTWWNPGHGWTSGHDWTPLNGTVRAPRGAAVAAVSRAADQLDVFVVANEGTVWRHGWSPADPWDRHAWSRVGATFTTLAGSPVSALSRSADTLDLFVVGADGGVYRAAWSMRQGWHVAWRRIAAGFTVPARSPVTAVARSAEQVDLFVIGADGRVYSYWWNPADGWDRPDGWFAVPGSLRAMARSAVGATARRANQLDVFAVATDGTVRGTWWNPTDLWDRHETWFAIGAASGPMGRHGVQALSRDEHRIDLVVQGGAGEMRWARWHALEGWSREWTALGGAALVRPQTLPAVLSRKDDQIDLFTAAMDGRALTAWGLAG